MGDHRDSAEALSCQANVGPSLPSLSSWEEFLSCQSLWSVCTQQMPGRPVGPRSHLQTLWEMGKGL